MIRGIILLLLLLQPILAWSDTSMNIIVEKYHLKQCANELITIADQVIGSKKHRLHPVFATEKSNHRLVTISGVLSYRDRKSHIVFSSSPTTEQLNGCDVSYNESFVIASPCILVREEVFKKWPYKGRLNDDTQVFVNKKDNKKLAYLTNASDNAYCLVSIKKSVFN